MPFYPDFHDVIFVFVLILVPAKVRIRAAVLLSKQHADVLREKVIKDFLIPELDVRLSLIKQRFWLLEAEAERFPVYRGMPLFQLVLELLIKLIIDLRLNVLIFLCFPFFLFVL